MPVWVTSRPTFQAEATWTPEEDEKLLELEEKYYGLWDDIPNELKLNHTPYECEVRCLELSQQKLRAKMQQHKDPELMFPPSENWDTQSSRNVGTVVAANSAPEIDTTISLRNSLESLFNISFDELGNDIAIAKLGECEEKVRELRKEKDQLVEQVEQKDLAIKEAVGLLEEQFLVAYFHALKTKLQGTQQVETKEEDFSTGDSLLDNPPSKRLKISSERNYLHFSGGSQVSIHQLMMLNGTKSRSGFERATID